MRDLAEWHRAYWLWPRMGPPAMSERRHTVPMVWLQRYGDEIFFV